MFRRLWLSVIAVVMTAASVQAVEPVNVAILPFDTHVPEAPAELKAQIRDLVSTQLRKEGIGVVELAPAEDVARETQGAQSLETLRNQARNAGADYVLWGSYTQIGNAFSLDAKYMESDGRKPPQVLYVEGEGVENLLDSVRELASELSAKLLNRVKVSEVTVAGNKRIEAEAIKRVLKTKTGELYSAANIRDDVRSIFKMGYFGDVQAEATTGRDGKSVTFRVAEKETVRNVRIKGNRKFKDEKIKEMLKTRPGAILNLNTLRSDVKELNNLYKEEGYHHAEVSYKTSPASENRVDVELEIDEGDKVHIKSIAFSGNRTFEDDTLKDLMKTQEKGFFSWFTSSGDLDREVLNQDTEKIVAYYHNHGYVQARVGEPQVRYEGNWIYVDMKVEEGPQFKVGKVGLEGELIRPAEELLETIKIDNEQVYNREVIRNDVLALGDLYSDEGYAYADIFPRVDQDLETQQANITYVIKKGSLVYFERIIITGNTKTRDKVIRRELDIYEQELFSGERLKKGSRNLYRLDFFEDIKVNTPKGSAEDKMTVTIDVEEKPTGTFTFGGGYSTVDNAFFMASVAQRNLFGRGQHLSLDAHIGGRTNSYTLSFTEPWLFDIPLSAGFDLYNTTMDYDTYDKDSTGGTLRGGYPIFEYTTASLGYNFERTDIRNLTDNASSAIRQFEGKNEGHTISGAVKRDSRDHIFSPTEGSSNSVSIKHAGTPFGGDIGYTKYVLDTGWYIPLFKGTVGFLHGRSGFIHGDPEGQVPVWERFYLGGINSIRGYDWRDISPVDPVTGDKIGGNKMIQFNVEFLFPIVQKSGLRGVLFYDTGNVYNNGEDYDVGDLKKTAGGGFRWYSPLGPIRIEWGYILDKDRRGEQGWEFTMGAAF